MANAAEWASEVFQEAKIRIGEPGEKGAAEAVALATMLMEEFVRKYPEEREVLIEILSIQLRAV
jgi:hypothetical protein